MEGQAGDGRHVRVLPHLKVGEGQDEWGIRDKDVYEGEDVSEGEGEGEGKGEGDQNNLRWAAGRWGSAGPCMLRYTPAAGMYLGMGVRDIFKSRQLSSQLFFKKNGQGNCQVNCATKNFLQGNCQVNSFSKNFVKAIVKSIVLQKNSSSQLSSQLFGEKLFYFLCQLLWFFGRFWSIMVNFGWLWSIMVNYR